MTNKTDLDNRFAYHPPVNDVAVGKHQDIRSAAHQLADVIDDYLPDSREKSLAVTAVEEAMFWANAGIARMDHNGERR